jgi:Ser/Thr protein kinase RdoA (MazF antagonist)
LAGGNVAVAVVRVGSTVRKPATAATSSVHAVLQHLESIGFSAAPRSFGLDEQGRHVLEFIPGAMANSMPAMTVAELQRVGQIIRDLHDALAEFAPPRGALWQVPIAPDRTELICHHDLAPWNLVRDRDRWVFIDWDGAGPGSRLWDLAYAAKAFVPLSDGNDPTVDAPRLRALVDGYGLDEQRCGQLPRLTAARTRAMYGLLVAGAATGHQPWARLHAEGHADHWGPAAEYINRNLDTWSTALLS